MTPEKELSADDWKALAATAPIFHSNEKTTHSQYGNNFYLIFLYEVLENDDPDNLLVARLPGTEYPDSWEAFLAENSELIQQINERVKGLELYEKLTGHYRDLLLKGNMEEAEELNMAVKHLAGIEAIGIFEWDKLNPLLRKAAEEMKKRGIPPEDFF